MTSPPYSVYFKCNNLPHLIASSDNFLLQALCGQIFPAIFHSFKLKTRLLCTVIWKFENEYNLGSLPVSNKDLFDWSHSTLYPDVLKTKTIIVEKQNFTKVPFVYYLQIHNLATLLPGHPSCRVVRLWIYKLVNNIQLAFL